ncbi:helicase associated domain-containing protein [Streptomyces sp. NPDC056626]|uniref:helicase associated domain-containing protein n=1 Tax=unclassified Streptomyces TaxID=2593676 RepID=UPI0036C90D18
MTHTRGLPDDREGLAAARGWAAENGHLAAPTDATYQGYRVGTWLENARAATRRAAVDVYELLQPLPRAPVIRQLSRGRIARPDARPVHREPGAVD